MTHNVTLGSPSCLSSVNFKPWHWLRNGRAGLYLIPLSRMCWWHAKKVTLWSSFLWLGPLGHQSSELERNPVDPYFITTLPTFDQVVGTIRITFCIRNSPKREKHGNKKWVWKPSECIKTSGYVCFIFLYPSPCKKIKSVLPILLLTILGTKDIRTPL